MVNVHFIRQKETRRLGHAIFCSKTFVGDKLGFLQATVEYALRKEGLRDGFIEYLTDFFK